MSDQPVPGQPSAQGGQNPASWPGDDWPGDEDWPNEDNLAFPWPDPPEMPWLSAGPPQPPGWRRHAAGLTVAAVLAAGAGVGLALSFDGSGGATPAASSSSPAANVPNGGNSGGETNPGGITGPGGASGSGGVSQLYIIGQITAVNSTSITLAAGGQPITAAITSATKVTGNIHSIASLAVGDTVSAQITATNGKATATSIQDPPEQQEPPLGTSP
jgi:hypothetical protein